MNHTEKIRGAVSQRDQGEHVWTSVITDLQAFSRNGQPAQRTTGVLKANWIQRESCPPSASLICFSPGTISPIASKNTGSVRTAPIQNRQVRSSSSLWSSTALLRRHWFKRHPADRAGAQAYPRLLRDASGRCTCPRMQPCDSSAGHSRSASTIHVRGLLISLLFSLTFFYFRKRESTWCSSSTNSDGCIGLAFGCFESWPSTQVCRWLVRNSLPANRALNGQRKSDSIFPGNSDLLRSSAGCRRPVRQSD